MYDDGFTDIVSMDYSETVVKKMQDALKFKPAIRFEMQDVRSMTYKEGEFDLLVDKGTLDAILCGNDSSKNAALMLEQCCRVLKSGGYFFIFTYGHPQSRLSYLERPKLPWQVQHHTLGKTKFMYVMKKK